jgi:hypothetical protein
MPQTLQAFLQELENQPDPEAESSIRRRIAEFVHTSLHDQDSIEARSENIAFSLMDVPDGSKWGVVYGPLATYLDEGGAEIDAPSLELVNSEVIDYWKRRSSEARNPIFTFRYSDLVWEFSSLARGEKTDVQFAHRTIDAAIQIAQRRCHKYDIEVFQRLERALSLSLSIGDSARLTRVGEALIAFQNLVSEDKLPGTWTSAFDSLVLNKKITLTSEQKADLVGDLEARLQRFLQGSVEDESWLSPAETATDRLARYYTSANDLDKRRLVLESYTQIVLNSAQHQSGLAALFWINQLHDLLQSYGMQAEADDVSQHLKAAGEKAERELKPISVSVSVPAADLENYFDQFTSGSLADAFMRIAGHFIPRSHQIQQQLRDLSSKSPLTSLLTRSILDRDGRLVAQIGSLEEDPAGHYISMLNQNIQFESPFLREIINRVLVHFEVDETVLSEHLETSPLFEPSRHKQLAAGLSAYLQHDGFAAVAILVPLIEAAIRGLLTLNRSSIYKRGRHGGVDLRLLGDCIRDQTVLSTLGEDICNYLVAVLIDPRGWNIRNNFCHGVFHDEHFAPAIADRVFHILLVLGVVRRSEEET